MRTLRMSLAGTVILMLLGGLGGAVAAQDEAAPASDGPHQVSGTLRFLHSFQGSTIAVEEGRYLQRGLGETESIEMDDPRLLTGIFTTQQGDEMAPAAVTESPSPMTTDELLSGMVTEEVEPGVIKVVNDGERDLVLGPDAAVVVGRDEGIWLLREDQFYRLGTADTHAWPTRREVKPQDHYMAASPGFEVTPDGTIWVFDYDDGCTSEVCSNVYTGDLRSSEGDGWTTRWSPPGEVLAMETAPDGTIWATWGDDCQVGHLEPTGWQPLDLRSPYPPPEEGSNLPCALGLFITDSGDVYASDTNLSRYEDGVWTFYAAPGQPGGVGPDGTVWRIGMLRSAQDHEPFAPGLENEVGLVRRVGDVHEWWTRDDLLDAGFDDGFGHEFQVAPDGSLWFSVWRSLADRFWTGGSGDRDYIEEGRAACDGVARFDGVTFDRLLPGGCIPSMDIAADGSVWVAADADLYVITPKAVAGGPQMAQEGES